MQVHLKGDISAEKFSELLLKIGDGNCIESEGKITTPTGLGKVVTSLKDLIADIYSDIQNITKKSMDWLCERPIFTPKNDTAAEINHILLNSFNGQSIEFKSVDSVLQDDNAVHYPSEILNTLNPPGFPAHQLILKIGTPIMLLRNLNPPKLCNVVQCASILCNI
ncbi:unnamed protein product [Ceutorhynchus assimilis]|uniref:DNA helicase Pif1-like 2B domain-containing protein n=1 Tax=Ceutorhynchus assimilis TaxID=467358 RepID=A0A9N9MTJ4_9CUCU|nr:unnamed protein product [Ceutorhynchus assimilis]